jgi:hypothetical protein
MQYEGWNAATRVWRTSTGTEINNEKEIAVKPTTCSALVLTATTTAADSNPSAQGYQVALTIPFIFVVGDRLLPCGNYLITANRATPEALSICNPEKNLQVRAKGWAMNWYPESTDAIVFHKFRNIYSLTDIHFASSSINIHFPTITTGIWMNARQSAIESLAMTSTD